MTRLLILVEGMAEELFVKQTLTPFLIQRNLYLAPPVVLWTRRLPAGGGHRGGVSSWQQILRSLKPLTYDSSAWVTTLLDFYGLPSDFPGQGETKHDTSPRTRVQALQSAFAAAVDHPRFIPFLALHELEAWLFCSPEVVADHFGRPNLVETLRTTVTDAGEPELINQGVDTHPKARLQAMRVGYKETSDGPTLLNKIGIPAIRTACPHFADWLGQLEALSRKAE